MVTYYLEKGRVNLSNHYFISFWVVLNGLVMTLDLIKITLKMANCFEHLKHVPRLSAILRSCQNSSHKVCSWRWCIYWCWVRVVYSVNIQLGMASTAPWQSLINLSSNLNKTLGPSTNYERYFWEVCLTEVSAEIFIPLIRLHSLTVPITMVITSIFLFPVLFTRINYNWTRWDQYKWIKSTLIYYKKKVWLPGVADIVATLFMRSSTSNFSWFMSSNRWSTFSGSIAHWWNLHMKEYLSGNENVLSNYF